jgi:GT2 family glycosyltransferase
MGQRVPCNIAVLILFYNKLEQTADCINSFLPAGERIYVLNNGSPAADFIKLKDRFLQHASVKFMDAGSNLGPAGGRNYLIRETIEPWLFCVDNDIIVKESCNWLEKCTDLINRNEGVDAFVPRLYNLHEAQYAERYNLYIEDDFLKSKLAMSDFTNNFPGGAVIVNKKVFEKYGLYDEKMFAFEDFEMAIRALKSIEGPLRCLFVGDIELIHDHRYQKVKVDKKAVKERYDDTRLTASFLHLEHKHNVIYDHNWRHWTDTQVERMTKAGWQIKIKNLLASIFKFKN